MAYRPHAARVAEGSAGCTWTADGTRSRKPARFVYSFSSYSASCSILAGSLPWCDAPWWSSDRSAWLFRLCSPGPRTTSQVESVCSARCTNRYHCCCSATQCSACSKSRAFASTAGFGRAAQALSWSSCPSASRTDVVSTSSRPRSAAPTSRPSALSWSRTPSRMLLPSSSRLTSRATSSAVPPMNRRRNKFGRRDSNGTGTPLRFHGSDAQLAQFSTRWATRVSWPICSATTWSSETLL
jgi:hypothetical protein